MLRELDNKVLFIKQTHIDPDEVEFNFLAEEANQHSARIEKPKALLYDPHIDQDLKELRKREFNYFKGSLEKAWLFSVNNFDLPLKEESIKKLAGLIDPHFFEAYSDDFLKTGRAPYRRITDGVRPSGAKHTPPYPVKVPFEMSKFIKNVHDLSDLIPQGLLHPAELAFYFHFNIVRIHPFPDANGRTSRMVQDSILRKYSFPAAAIKEGERRTYINLLSEAEEGYKTRDSPSLLEISEQERVFYTFLADKVNISLDYILDKP